MNNEEAYNKIYNDIKKINRILDDTNYYITQFERNLNNGLQINDSISFLPVSIYSLNNQLDNIKSKIKLDIIPSIQKSGELVC